MFLIDPCDLSVHEVPKDHVTVATGGSVSRPQDQEERTGIMSGMLMEERFPECHVDNETLVFVKLEKDRGWVWASTCSVRNHPDSPCDRRFPTSAKTLGDDFLFLWPVPVAIHVYMNIKDKRRRQVANHNSGFHAQVLDPPPCFSYLPNKRNAPGYLELPTVRKVSVQQLTVAQRLFVASLTANVTPFAKRKPTDKWCAKLGDQDRAQFEAWRSCEGGSCSTSPHQANTRRVVARKSQRKARCNHKGACHLLGLPDDLLERVISTCLSECLHSTTEVRSAVSGLITVSTQFRRATWSVVDHMLERVGRAAASLMTDEPREPLEVQAITQAASLSLRHALLVVPGDWPWYLRLRGRSSCGAGVGVGRKRHDLLWCHE